MTNTRAINAAAGVIHACIQQGKPLPVSIAFALESAGLLNSPEHAAEVEKLRAKTTELTHRRTEDLTLRGELAPADGPRVVPMELGSSLVPAVQWLIGRVTELEAELFTEQTQHRFTLEQRNAHATELRGLRAAAGDGSTRPVDEDPIAYSLTPEALHASSGAVIAIPGHREDGIYPQGTAARIHIPDPTCPVGGHIPGAPCDDQCTTQARGLAELRIRLEGGTP